MADPNAIRENIRKMRAQGASDEEVEQYVAIEARRSGAAPAMPERKKPGRLSGGYAQGVMKSAEQLIPFANEAVSGISTALGYNPQSGEYFDYSRPLGKSYSQNLAAERGALSQFRQDYPYDAMVAEGAPALATGVGMAKAAAAKVPSTFSTLARALTPETGSVVGNIGRGSVAASVPGYVYGYSAGEGGVGNRMESGKNTALVSALLGGGFTAAGEAAPRLLNAGGRLVSRVAGREGVGQGSPELRKLAKTIMDENPNMSPEEAITWARMRHEQLGPESTNADLGKGPRLLAGTIERQGGAPATVIREKVIHRQEGFRDPETEVLSGSQSGRIGRHLNDIVPESTTATRANLRTSDEVERSFYKDAYAANQQMDSPELRRLLKTPMAQRALKQVSESFRNRGKKVSQTDPELTALVRELEQIGKMAETKTGAGIGRGLKLETLDLIKRRLDFIASKGSGSQIPKVASDAQDAGQLAKELRNELDRLDVTARAGPKSFKPEGGAYAQARGRAQKRIKARNALRDGEGFLNKGTSASPEELRAAWSEMTPEEKNSARISFIGALKNRAGNAEFSHDATRGLYGNENLEEKLRLLFENDETFARYIRGLRNERDMFKLYREITGGSQTQERQTAARALNGEPAGAAGVALDVAANAPTRPYSTVLGLIPRAGRAAYQWATRMPESQRLKLAKALMNRDVAGLTEQAVLANMSDEGRRRLIQALVGSNVAATPVNSRAELMPR